jgi:hypothetical protein
MSSRTASRLSSRTASRHPRLYLVLGVATAVVLAAAVVLIATGSRGRARPAGAPSATLVAAARASKIPGLVPDPYAPQSYPEPANAPPHADAVTPHQAALATTVAPGAPSDAEVRAELQQLAAIERAQRAHPHPGTIDQATGTVTPPHGLPPVIDAVIAGANAIATFPYRYGGGHLSFVDNAYDCSGSVGYALAAGGLLSGTVVSGQLENWGVPGPGRYLTVYANAGHTFMYVDGLRYDTVGRSGIFGTRWQTGPPPEGVAGFVVRHWPGL